MVEKRIFSDDEFRYFFEKHDGDLEKIAEETGYHLHSIPRKLKKLGLLGDKIIRDDKLVEIFHEFDGDIKKVIEATGLHRNTVHKRLKILGLIHGKRKITDQEIIDACKSSSNMSIACKKVGMYKTPFIRRAKKLGAYKPNQGDRSSHTSSLGFKLEDILSGKHPQYTSGSLRKRLINEGIFKDECSKCGFNEHREGFEHSICQLHHINGNPRDHRLENLEILCPNCHALTPNFGFSKRFED